MRYFTLKNYLNLRFGGPTAKITLDAGLTCPNRDGTLSSRGCIFCDAKGSGTGARQTGLSIPEQIERGLERSSRRADRFIAYFQSYTNTYAPVDKLKSMWDHVLDYESIVGLAIGTRPDCLPSDVLDLLAGYRSQKDVWLELGLQSANDNTLKRINRGHTASDFAAAVKSARERNLSVIAHVIIGLPGEGLNEALDTARFISDLDVDGVKIHSLYVVENTALAKMFHNGEYECLSLEDYVETAVRFIENIPPQMVVHRLTGDPPPDVLLAPEWSKSKAHTINLIRRRLEILDSWQGKALGAPGPEPETK